MNPQHRESGAKHGICVESSAWTLFSTSIITVP